MPRAIWTGAISFGLVTVPVRLYSAVNRKTVRFNQLDSTDNGRIAQRRVNPRTGEEVPYERLVKGYEIAPDSYVIITDEELDSLEPEKTRTIDIEDFVEESRDPADLLRPSVLPGARPRRRQALPPAAGGDARDRQGRDRPRGDPLQGEPRGHPPVGRRAGDVHDAVRRRGQRPVAHRGAARGRRRQDDRQGAVDRQAARRLAGRRRSSPTSTTTSTASRSSP